MRSFTILIAVALFPTYARAQSTVPFTPGMVVTGSTRIEPGTYDVPGPESLEDALIVVRGDGVTLDLSGVTLRGLPVEADPDLATGVAIRVDGGTDIAIRGGVIRGYRFGVLARDTRGLRVLDVDLSYGWKPRLFSLLAHESLVDWLSYHNNEEREWMRFGAALYLDGVKGGEVRGVRAVQGMNGLLMSYSDSIRVQDNDFSYNSGLGVGLYHASGNVIVRNLLDYDVRGYGEGFYERGQDSAGLLVYAQSSGNVIAYNSATHSGDGFFLWAGQRTMDTGEGGANDNLLFHNDFSYAPTNGIEVTFSRNRIVGNIVRGNRYGVWGGYSWETVIRGNCFADNRFGVAIEHGQDNVILGNQFDGDSLAISLWARASEPADWGYARARDTRSRDHLIRNNLFAGNAQIWRLERTEGHEIGSNSVRADRPADRCDPRVLLGTAFDSLAPELPGVPRQIPAAPRAELPRSAIVVDAWGPWDGRSPKLWPVDTVTTEVVLRVLGPPGEWRVVGRRGLVAVSRPRGRTGETVRVAPDRASVGDWALDLEYTGERTVSPRGTVRAAGEPVRFRYERFEPARAWDVRFFDWGDADAAPTEDVFAGTPILARREPRIDYEWYTPRIDALPRERWAAEATTTVTLPQGVFSLRTISDDGVRVWLDGALVIDAWEPHGSEVDYAPITPGTHDIRVRYFQRDGWSEWRTEIVRGDARSRGSAGPH
jgi:parallel beta-helix repeat protein